MKYTIIMATLTLVLLIMATLSEAGWLVFHAPEFKGTILDIETKKPIEGVVVVVEYKKATMGLGAGSISSIIDVRESLTDKNGKFRFPSYSTVIQPFSWKIPSYMIIFKPGYASLELNASYFTGEQTKEQEGSWPNSELKALKYKIIWPGVVAIPKLKTWEERNKADMITIDIPKSKWPILNNLIEKEETWLKQNKGWRENCNENNI